MEQASREDSRMTYGYGPANTQSSYLPPEFQINDGADEPNELIAQRERLTATILNVKTNGQFEKQELLTAEQWFATSSTPAKITRYGYRKAFDLVELNGGTEIPADGAWHAFAHNLNVDQITVPIRIFGAASLPGNVTLPTQYVPLPYPSATANSVIELYFDNTNININVGTNNTGGLNPCYVVIEYLKQA